MRLIEGGSEVERSTVRDPNNPKARKIGKMKDYLFVDS